MTDDIDEAEEWIEEVIEELYGIQKLFDLKIHQIETLRQDRAELRRALYEVSYMLNSLEVLPSAMTKTTSDTLVRLNLGGFND
jgi:hypothetical protein